MSVVEEKNEASRGVDRMHGVDRMDGVDRMHGVDRMDGVDHMDCVTRAAGQRQESDKIDGGRGSPLHLCRTQASREGPGRGSEDRYDELEGRPRDMG